MNKFLYLIFNLYFDYLRFFENWVLLIDLININGRWVDGEMYIMNLLNLLLRICYIVKMNYG